MKKLTLSACLMFACASASAEDELSKLNNGLDLYRQSSAISSASTLKFRFAFQNLYYGNLEAGWNAFESGYNLSVSAKTASSRAEIVLSPVATNPSILSQPVADCATYNLFLFKANKAGNGELKAYLEKNEGKYYSDVNTVVTANAVDANGNYVFHGKQVVLDGIILDGTYRVRVEYVLKSSVIGISYTKPMELRCMVKAY